MRLLSTDRAELHYFASPEAVPGGYAILSHVWDPYEQTYQDLCSLRAQCALTGENPRDRVCSKLRESCFLAERHGYKWLWADTCCIDKTSSSELSESINSMYRFYGLAEVCYAYLKDVPKGGILSSRDSAFRRSRWHTRGWTLQELIAPDIVIFLSSDWHVLGTKGELARLLEEITLVPVEVLRLEEELSNVSAARRMSWAATRQTTKEEDEAYCLMGIFGINMPTLYGEGREAFTRLQEEILKRSIDTSLFAWGQCWPVPSMPPPSPQSSRHSHIHDDKSCLLAMSPSAFASCNQISFNPPRSPPLPQGEPISSGVYSDSTGETEVFLDALDFVQPGLPTFSVTPYGLRAHVMLFEYPSYSVAVLCCANKDGKPLGLLLQSCPVAPDPHRPLYHPGVDRFRTVALSDDFIERGVNGVFAEWKVVYIIQQARQDAGAGPRLLLNRNLSTPFRFCKEELERLLRQHLWSLETLTRVDFDWNGSPPVSLAFKHKINDKAVIILSLGRCQSTSRMDYPHWATLRFYQGQSPPNVPEHTCSEDHICQWPDRKKVFKLSVEFYGIMNFFHDITLSFATCPMNPSTTLVVTIA
ncbi:HET-domain-containing protein [Dichomitus squalens LYAD-421 SS1]|uniref:HET-domain-containing protein n=1 Tax=Dichomitus squalens (strain LYAD-421) TaxID=732165 RepID=R7SKS8_DICSQ|nr:HET-domain-containing protein [Dichomitus squalens LYAD-421 SS1]EJF56751.1 HET-domain-containing protein [Dichomitus squalens LYAD-421 SS1]